LLGYSGIEGDAQFTCKWEAASEVPGKNRTFQLSQKLMFKPVL